MSGSTTPFGGLNKDALLNPSTRDRSGGAHDFVSLRPVLEQYNPPGLVRVALTGEKEGDEIVSRKVNEIRLSAVMLELGEDFKLVGLVGIFLCFPQDFLLDNLYIKVLCFNIIFVFAVEV